MIFLSAFMLRIRFSCKGQAYFLAGMLILAGVAFADVLTDTAKAGGIREIYRPTAQTKTSAHTCQAEMERLLAEKEEQEKELASLKEQVAMNPNDMVIRNKWQGAAANLSLLEKDVARKEKECLGISSEAEMAELVELNERSSQKEMERINRIKKDKIDKFMESYGEEAELPSSGFIVPVDDYIITSQFGYRIHPIYGDKRFHSGTDLGVDYGTPVRASNWGKVIYSGWYSGFGNTVIITHADGVYTLYGHNESLLVNEGELVERGQIIARAGSTGNSTGPHCHFSMWMNNELVDPMDYAGKE